MVSIRIRAEDRLQFDASYIAWIREKYGSPTYQMPIVGAPHTVIDETGTSNVLLGIHQVPEQFLDFYRARGFWFENWERAK